MAAATQQNRIHDVWSEDAEKAVIGSILIDGYAIKSVHNVISAKDFYHSGYAAIYQAMLDLEAKGIAVDLVTTIDRLTESGKLKIVGGAAVVSELSDIVASSSNVQHYAKIVRDKSIRRSVVSQARNIATKANDVTTSLEDIPTSLSIDCAQKMDVNHVDAAIKQLNANIEKGYPGLNPGYDLLARTIRKVTPGHLWVVGAYTSVGKSAWLVDFICRQYRKSFDNPGIAIFSTEMSAEQYILRLLSNHTKIPSWAITENSCHPQQQAELVNAQIFYSQRNLYVYDKLYRIEDIDRAARLIKKTRRLDIIAIDYLQNTWGEGTIYERMSRLAPILQYLAKELQVTIIGLSQVSNQFQRDKSSSGVFGFKGAGEIAASADVGIELERDSEDKSKIIFKVSKNRHGRTGQGMLVYLPGYVRLDEVDDNEGMELPKYGG
jgi:replicative DNA helicase